MDLYATRDLRDAVHMLERRDAGISTPYFLVYESLVIVWSIKEISS